MRVDWMSVRGPMGPRAMPPAGVTLRVDAGAWATGGKIFAQVPALDPGEPWQPDAPEGVRADAPLMPAELGAVANVHGALGLQFHGEFWRRLGAERAREVFDGLLAAAAALYTEREAPGGVAWSLTRADVANEWRTEDLGGPPAGWAPGHAGDAPARAWFEEAGREWAWRLAAAWPWRKQGQVIDVMEQGRGQAGALTFRIGVGNREESDGGAEYIAGVRRDRPHLVRIYRRPGENVRVELERKQFEADDLGGQCAELWADAAALDAAWRACGSWGRFKAPDLCSAAGDAGWAPRVVSPPRVRTQPPAVVFARAASLVVGLAERRPEQVAALAAEAAAAGRPAPAGAPVPFGVRKALLELADALGLERSAARRRLAEASGRDARGGLHPPHDADQCAAAELGAGVACMNCTPGADDPGAGTVGMVERLQAAEARAKRAEARVAWLELMLADRGGGDGDTEFPT